MVFIYILELENTKYYIGKTSNPDIRLGQHFNSFGSEWTKKHKPKKILEIIPNCDNFDEDKYTLKYMEKYGINNVRGGAFCELYLNKDNLETIKKMINSSTDKCYICSENGHFAKNCYHENNTISEESNNLLPNNKFCSRCYRKGHYTYDCYAKTIIKCSEIKDSIDKEDEDKEDEEIEVFCCKLLCCVS